MSNRNKATWLITAIVLTAVALNLVQEANARPGEAPDSATEQATSNWSSVEEMGGSSSNNANDQRSNVMNPNNDAFNAAGDNRSNQMNPNNSAYWSSRGR